MDPLWSHLPVTEAAMRNLSIKKVPDEIVEKLRQRADSNRRSLQGELMEIVCRAVAPGEELHTSSAHRRTGTKNIEEIAAERHGLGNPPDPRVPSAADILRADRDAR